MYFQSLKYRITDQIIEYLIEQEQSDSGQQGSPQILINKLQDDYDYYESQAARKDRIKARAKPFGKLPFHPSTIQKTRKLGDPQFRKEAGDNLATLAGYLNMDIKKINRLSFAVMAQKLLVAKFKQQGIKGGPYMKQLSTSKPHKEREIKANSFRTFTIMAKKFINENGGAKLPIATKQQIMAADWNSALTNPAVVLLESQD
ncbi:MAG: hypothetical protein EZS28_000205 [Streblomastix strix]|uniref:Uncharacterized protein n=1 Tax=Streblomastix strix TaxID=222440 RepID=A0A5J4XBH4_9EUKA|nr:MAG: hypothetical protein EZS28_000205 [Streblomastix strix]